MSMVTVVIVFLKDPSDFDLQNPVAGNLGTFISDESSHFLHRFGVSMDLFSFWQIFLLGTGLAACARLTRTKGIVAVVIPWLIYVLVVSGFAAMSGR